MRFCRSVVWCVLFTSTFGLMACQNASDEPASQVERKLASVHAVSTPLPSPQAFDSTVQAMDYQGKYNPFVSPFRSIQSSDESVIASGDVSKLSDSSNKDMQTKLNLPLLGKVVQVDIHRPKQPLERYLLTQLRYAGVLKQGDRLVALVSDPDGAVHRVEVGRYLGQNHGRIVHISREQIVVSGAVRQADGRHYEQVGYLRLSP